MILWKYFLTLNKRDEEQGFTIALVLGFGLFMISIGLLSIKMGSDSQVNSQIQERTYQALAAAEVGATQFQEYLNQEPLVATLPACNTRDADGSCLDTGSASPSWANPDLSALPESTNDGNELCSDATSVVVPPDIASLATNNQTWTPIDPNDPAKGEYRLFSYSSSDNAGQFPAVGTLIVDGRTREANRGTTRLAVNIPIREVSQQDTAIEPGLWMQFNASANLGSQLIRGSVLIENQTCVANDPSSGLPSQLLNRSPIVVENGEATGRLLASRREMPDTPDLPPLFNLLSESQVFNTTLPRDTDLAYEGAFHYLVPKLEASGNPSIEIADGQRVVFYIQGNLEFRGTVNRLSSNSSSKNLEIYGNTTVDAGTGYLGSDYKYGCYTSAAGACPTQTMKLVGTSEISAFIHAPEAWACLTGGGAPTNANVTGAIWVNQWVASSDVFGIPSGMNNCTGGGNDRLVIDSVERDSNGDLQSLLPDNVKTDLLQPVTTVVPRLSASSNWERQEVTEN